MNISSLSQIKSKKRGAVSVGDAGARCQKCLEYGHRLYNCKGTTPYVSRPSRTKQLQKPIKLKRKKIEKIGKLDAPEGLADKILEQKEIERRKDKKFDTAPDNISIDSN